MIERDMIFEASAKQQGLFNNPAGLDYLHKINPGYFSRRRKMAKWLVKTQLKLFDIAMDGVANESDFDFMLMIQSLPETQLNLIDTPAHKLSSMPDTGDDGLYQEGALRKLALPRTKRPPNAIDGENRQVPFAGFTATNWNKAAVEPSNRSTGRGMVGPFGGVANWRNTLSSANSNLGILQALGF
jgi:hypothetical protein